MKRIEFMAQEVEKLKEITEEKEQRIQNLSQQNKTLSQQ